jgi:hypothetical protein
VVEPDNYQFSLDLWNREFEALWYLGSCNIRVRFDIKGYAGNRKSVRLLMLIRLTNDPVLYGKGATTRIFHSFAKSFVTNPSGTDLDRKATPKG